MIPLSKMQHGLYYYGSTTRIGVNTARWDGKRNCFWYNTSAWPDVGFITMPMNHAEQDDGCEIFSPTEVIDWGVNAIAID